MNNIIRDTFRLAAFEARGDKDTILFTLPSPQYCIAFNGSTVRVDLYFINLKKKKIHTVMETLALQKCLSDFSEFPMKSLRILLGSSASVLPCENVVT